MCYSGLFSDLGSVLLVFGQSLFAECHVHYVLQFASFLLLQYCLLCFVLSCVVRILFFNMRHVYHMS